MEHLKRMLGIVVGAFATLIVAGLCSFCFKPDFMWYIMLAKPQFLLSGGWFTLFVGVAYASSVLAIGRLVEFKHLFPSLVFFALLGISCVMFVLCFFRLKNLVASLVFICLVLGFSYVLFFRFLAKDFRLALTYLPAAVFNAYAFCCTVSIALQN